MNVVIKNNIIELKAKIASGEINLSQLDSKGESLLHLAVLSGDSRKVRLFIELGIDINVVNKRNETTLWMATFKRLATMIGILLEAGADITIPNNHNNLPREYVRDSSIAKLFDKAEEKLAKKANKKKLGKYADLLGDD